MELPTEKNEAEEVREKQRSEGEARDIIHDVEALNTLSEETKSRWVWELMQNANDVAKANVSTTVKEVNITCFLSEAELTFSHDGEPFKTENLTAILYKTSTKSLNSEDGSTGKYGTGFVTTHILNKKLTIAGVHINKSGQRRFSLYLNRSPVDLKEMEVVLRSTFNKINEITKIPSSEINDEINSFSYPLTQVTYEYAKRGIIELEKNLPFTLLVNDKIKSVTIDKGDECIKYSSSIEQTELENIQFIRLSPQNLTSTENGLLFFKSEELIFAIPVVKSGDSFNLAPIEDEAILFKEFPLIGTEEFNLPVFIQHKQFLPTEKRDGIRTKISSSEEQETDLVAEQNRKALLEFKTKYIAFIQTLINAKIGNTHLLAKSGLPEKLSTYSNEDWFKTNIQNPIRELILKKDIVTTFSGSSIPISKAKFISKDIENCDSFYELAAKLIPDVLPDENSIWHWSEIISQDINSWPTGIILKIEDLVKLVPEQIDLEKEESIEWLKELYKFLDSLGLAHLGEEYAIFPSESKKFCLKDDISIHPEIDDEFKIVSKGLGRFLDDEFLNRKIGKLSGIKTFDLPEFFNHLNKDLISDLDVSTGSEEEIRSVLHVCSLFKSDKAIKRYKWLGIINQLLPQYALEKRIVIVDYENYWRSAQLWSIKRICYLISKSDTPKKFAADYFEGYEKVCFTWLNEFISFIVELHEESREVILKKPIIPTQSDKFQPYDDYIFAELNSKYFDDTIKDLYRDFTKNEDPRNFLIDNRISFPQIKQKGVDILTNEIDKIFHDENIERKVKPGGELNKMFMILCAWYDQFPNIESNFLTKFSETRPYLNIIALGEGFSKQIMEIQSSGKTIEDIKELAKIKLSTTEMKQFELAVSDLGGAIQLLAKAEEMIKAKQQKERWKTIGDAAELAFTEALTEMEPTFEILNPDKGKDFVIVANGNEYAIEIKSVDARKGNVNMSIKQGETAVIEKDSYALCVVSRPENNVPVDKDYFIRESRFVVDIGFQIGSSIEEWSHGLQDLNTKADVKVSLDEKTESVYISRTIWKIGIPFIQFVEEHLGKYFNPEKS